MINLILGDCSKQLKIMSSEFIDCCVTSPPYWGLRDYGTAKWEGGSPDCKHARLGKSINANTGQRNTEAISGDGIYKEICKVCGAICIDSQLGLEKTPDCEKQGLLKMKDNLTTEERNYVLRELGFL